MYWDSIYFFKIEQGHRLMNWRLFSDRRPRRSMKGETRHVFILSDTIDGRVSLWWGFYNPNRKFGSPEFVPKYWSYMPALPGYAQTEEECIAIENKEEIEDATNKEFE